VVVQLTREEEVHAPFGCKTMHHADDPKIRSEELDIHLLASLAHGRRRHRLARLDMSGDHAQAAVFEARVAAAQKQDRVAAEQEDVYGYREPGMH
jgi:hypothetical protein